MGEDFRRNEEVSGCLSFFLTGWAGDFRLVAGADSRPGDAVQEGGRCALGLKFLKYQR